MSIDFDKLPPEEPVPDEPPSRLLWTIVFFVIALIGVFSVLLFWPKGEPTQTPWFWTCEPPRVFRRLQFLRAGAASRNVRGCPIAACWRCWVC